MSACFAHSDAPLNEIRRTFMDLHDIYHQETQRMPAVLLGVASAAIAFAFHQTADRELAWSLIPILVSVLCWSCSFASGVLFTRAYANGIKSNIAINLAEQANNDQWRSAAKTKFDEWNEKARRRYAAQQWLLLAGAGVYLAGHTWSIWDASYARPIATSQPEASCNLVNKDAEHLGQPQLSSGRDNPLSNSTK